MMHLSRRWKFRKHSQYSSDCLVQILPDLIRSGYGIVSGGATVSIVIAHEITLKIKVCSSSLWLVCRCWFILLRIVDYFWWSGRIRRSTDISISTLAHLLSPIIFQFGNEVVASMSRGDSHRWSVRRLGHSHHSPSRSRGQSKMYLSYQLIWLDPLRSAAIGSSVTVSESSSQKQMTFSSWISDCWQAIIAPRSEASIYRCSPRVSLWTFVSRCTRYRYDFLRDSSRTNARHQCTVSHGNRWCRDQSERCI